MPLINCPDCGKQCSTEAAACPNCGRPLKSVLSRRRGLSPLANVLLLIGLLGGCSFLFFIGSMADRQRLNSQMRDVPTASSPLNNTLPTNPPLELLSLRGGNEYGYFIVRGEVKNVSPEPLKSVTVVAEMRTQDGILIKSEKALIEYNPILPGQTSPFMVGGTNNPEIKTFTVAFKFFSGGEIPYTDTRNLNPPIKPQKGESRDKNR